MLKKSIIIATLFIMFSSVWAQVPVKKVEKLPEASVEVTAEFASNYVWRGSDLHGSSLASQKGRKQNGKMQAWAFQPNIKLNTPVEGLSFSIWGSFATNYRDDADSDQRIQQGPGGDSIEYNLALEMVKAADFTSLSSTTGSVSLHSPDCEATVNAAGDSAPNCVPGFYKEKNGLKRFDEVEFTLDYSRATSVGALNFGIVYYTYPNTEAKASSDEEVYVGYALPFLTQLSLTAYTNVTSGADSSEYILLAYADDHKINETITWNYKISAGYGIQKHLQGVQDISAKFGVGMGGFYVNLHATIRPDTRFHDEDRGVGGDTLPLYLTGQSTRADGLITDQSRSVGFTNTFINQQIQDAIDVGIGPGVYTYTPRQKLPREIYWLSIGYTYKI